MWATGRTTAIILSEVGRSPGAVLSRRVTGSELGSSEIHLPACGEWVGVAGTGEKPGDRDIAIVWVSDEGAGPGWEQWRWREEVGFWELLWVSINMPSLGTCYI